MAHHGLALAGIAVLAASFLLSIEPLAAVGLAGAASLCAAGLEPLQALALVGHAFNANRYVSLVWLVLPVVGLLEGRGLQAQARALVGRLAGATPGRILLAYLLGRQLTAALGLSALGGQAQMVRPLLAPLVEAAAAPEAEAEREVARGQELRAHAAAADNIGLFFGEDVFVAVGSILLIRGVLQGLGVAVEPLRLSLWAVPTAGAALAVHGARVLLLDHRPRRRRRAL